MVGAGAWAALAVARAQPRAPPADSGLRLIGLLFSQSREQVQPSVDAFVARMNARGYVVGRDIRIEARFASGDSAQLPVLARELVGLQPAVVVAVGSPPAMALARLTRSIPIVVSGSASPVEAGLVASLAHPGGNVTGSTYNQPEIAGKLVEVLKIAAPRVSRVALIWNSEVPGMRQYKPHADRTAQRLGVALHYVDLQRAQDFRVDVLDRIHPDALYVTWDGTLAAISNELVRYALERKLPTIGVVRQFADAGGLMSLSPDPEELWMVCADYVVRIFKGAAPGDLPIWQPSRFLLVVNRKTADAIGLPLSQELLLRASEVIH